MNEQAKAHWIAFEKGICGDIVSRIFIPNGITKAQAKLLDCAFQGIMTQYGEENDDDFGEFDVCAAIEAVCNAMGIEFEYPPVDYTIYV